MLAPLLVNNCDAGIIRERRCCAGEKYSRRERRPHPFEPNHCLPSPKTIGAHFPLGLFRRFSDVLVALSTPAWKNFSERGNPGTDFLPKRKAFNARFGRMMAFPTRDFLTFYLTATTEISTSILGSMTLASTQALAGAP